MTVFTIPPDNKIAGTSTGCTTDLNSTYEALLLVAGVNVLNTAYAGGADNTGTSACDSVLTAALAALPAAGGIIYMPPGTYRISTGWTATVGDTQTVVLAGAGPEATIINYYGTGDCIRMYDPSGNEGGWGSGVMNLTINGSTAGTGAVGLHVGDIGGLRLRDLYVTEFASTGGIGIHFDNAHSWTEQAQIRCSVSGCTQNVVFEVTTGSNSFAYGNYDFNLYSGAGQDGIVLKNGANIYSPKTFDVGGNFTSSSSVLTNAVLRMSGTAPAGTPDAGLGCTLGGANINFQLEATSGTYNPLTLVMDSNATFYGTGNLQFEGSFGASSISGNYGFSGLINGADTVLCPSQMYFWQAFGSQNLMTTLASPFSSGTGTGVQTVTGMALVVPLYAATFKIRAWIPMTPHGVTGGTQTLNWTYSGTTTAVAASWSFNGAGGGASTSLTTGGTSPTMTATGMVAEFTAVVTVSASGTLQLTTQSSVSGDEATFPVGSRIWIEQ